jgi:hypothetical protein
MCLLLVWFLIFVLFFWTALCFVAFGLLPSRNDDKLDNRYGEEEFYIF